MKTLTLITGADTDVLNRKAVPISLPFSDEIQQLLDEMIVVMRQEKGIGLAAPQVGISQRIGKNKITSQFSSPKFFASNVY